MQNKPIIDMCKTLYRDQYGAPFVLTEGQAEIADAIFTRAHPRVSVVTYTQYGKSEAASQAILSRIITYPDKYTIVAPTEKKASIVMGYLIDHIFDTNVTIQPFQIGKDESLERIRRERNKTHLTFRVDDQIGEVMVLTAEGRRVKDILSAMLGFGSQNVVLDESPLLSEDHYAGILRMLGGHKDNMLVEIGNAINRGHFYRSCRDPNYHHIVVDYEQGIREGRQTRSFFDEMREKMRPDLFGMLYECRFPESDTVDAQGYYPLVTDKELDRAYVNLPPFGDLRLGVDVAGGGDNFTVIILRGSNSAHIAFRAQTEDTMSIATEIDKIAKKHGVPFDPSHIFIDRTGVGQGLCNRMSEIYGQSFGVSFGGKASDPQYANVRAEAFWRSSEWIKQGGKVWPKPRFDEMLDIRYKIQSDKKIKIKGKDEMRSEGIASPDVADALALTFSEPPQNPAMRRWKQTEYSGMTNFGI